MCPVLTVPFQCRDLQQLLAACRMIPGLIARRGEPSACTRAAAAPPGSRARLPGTAPPAAPAGRTGGTGAALGLERSQDRDLVVPVLPNLSPATGEGAVTAGQSTAAASPGGQSAYWKGTH